jgi:hypothetical protein
MNNRMARFLARNRGSKRPRIAEAVHRAVCEFVGGDGVGECMGYAFAGCALTRDVFRGANYIVQAGTLHVWPDPDRHPDYCVAFASESYGPLRGEFHCWITRAPDNAKPGTMIRPVEIVDFSARHYRALCERTACVMLPSDMERPAWNRPEVPYIWIDGDQQPETVHLISDPIAMDIVYAKFNSKAEEYKPLFRLALEHYARLER